MLEAGGLPVLVDNIREADIDNPLGYYEYEPVKALRDDASWIALSKGKGVKMVHLLLYDLPPGVEYRVLFMHRNLDEVLASQKAMLAQIGSACALRRRDDGSNVPQPSREVHCLDHRTSRFPGSRRRLQCNGRRPEPIAPRSTDSWAAASG